MPCKSSCCCTRPRTGRSSCSGSARTCRGPSCQAMTRSGDRPLRISALPFSGILIARCWDLQARTHRGTGTPGRPP
ncbi:Os04g0632400 [Oryza sativa Japonica Group]|uniref:Os04g0632400 protein n=1 Tax=Oryza sativa subsp. japonica TaxID=39947 RepID=A0A0P0WFD6_ORYSJ|nr:hypothetical protein EE612_025748 [Oryza sativa]BAS91182.1 Os04g0632400 [Oryza sativa Japonica Group]